MAPENRGHHLDLGEAAVAARRESDRMGACDLRLAAADLSMAPELLLRTRRLRARRRSLSSFVWRGCHLLSDTASITYAGLEQLGDGSLIGLEQFIRPLQTLKPFAQRLDLMIMRLDFLLDRSDLLAQSLFERIYRFILTMVPEGPLRGSYSASWLSLCSVS